MAVGGWQFSSGDRSFEKIWVLITWIPTTHDANARKSAHNAAVRLTTVLLYFHNMSEEEKTNNQEETKQEAPDAEEAPQEAESTATFEPVVRATRFYVEFA